MLYLSIFVINFVISIKVLMEPSLEEVGNNKRNLNAMGLFAQHLKMQ